MFTLVVSQIRGQKNVLILPEPRRMILPQIILRKYSENEGGKDARIDAHTQVSQLGDKYRREDFVESKLGILLMQQPERDGKSEAGKEHVRHELWRTISLIDIWRRRTKNSPRISFLSRTEVYLGHPTQ